MSSSFQPFRSVRARLTLWNVLVLAVALVGTGLVFNFVVRADLSRTVDRQLLQGAQGMQGWFADMPQFRADRMLGIADPNDRPGRDRRGSPDRERSANGRPAENGFRSPGGSGARSPGAPGGPGRRGPGGAGPGGFAALRQGQAFGQLWPRMFKPNGTAAQPDDKPWDVRGLSRAITGHQVFSTIGKGNAAIRVLSFPLYRDGKLVGACQTANSLILLQQEQRATTRTLLALIPVVLLFAGLGGAFLTGRALRPVRDLAHAAGTIGGESLSDRLPVTGKDEFSDLAVTFNGMLSRLQEAFQGIERSYEQHRRFTADASHELRTPLTIVKANASLALSSSWNTVQYREAMQAVDAASDRMNRIVQDLLLLARADGGQLINDRLPTSVAVVLEEAAIGVQIPDYAPVSIAVEPADLSVVGQADGLVRLFSNLLENAARHTPGSGKIGIVAKAKDKKVIVTVTDTGEGIAPEHLPHVMERFYRVDAARTRTEGGTGLGLSICQSIVQSHDGTMEMASTVGKGTTVTVSLPRADKVSSDSVSRNGHSPGHTLRETAKKP